MFCLIDEKKRKETEVSLLKDMEATAARMRKLIVGMPPLELLGYIYAHPIFLAKADKSVDVDGPTEADAPKELVSQNQFLLEYLHAVLASDAASDDVKFDETTCAELFELSRNLREQAMKFALVSSVGTKTGVFGPDTARVEIQTKSNWVTLRGNRYYVVEGEFYRYVLAPHDKVLKEIYGVGADDIAKGFQAMAHSTRSGHFDAISEVTKQYHAAQAFADENQKPLKDITGAWGAKNPEQLRAVHQAMDDVFRGGVANVSKHTKLPATLLEDLAYTRGEETEFFAAGDFAGTPYRTLPARKKPLIQLGSDYYAVDRCFARDAGYRALLLNLLRRRPDYKKTFIDRQKMMSEAAFADIFSAQLPGAQVFQEIYYKHPDSKQWCENDMLILIDDVLILVEAKAGARATVASPELDFDRHVQSVQDLVLKAYKQCDRFFRYLDSADEVLLYKRTDGKREECGRIRRSDYRVMVPIGLTVESFSPLAASCKDLAQIEPLIGKHAFISLSIDDLFVLKRILSTPGSFAHYLEVRQAFAGIRRAHLFDEFDHLGAYLSMNRFDQEFAELLKGKADMVLWEGRSDIVDKYFAGENWETQALPTQRIPDEVLKLLDALDATRARGWLSAESCIRDVGEESKNNLARLLRDHRNTLTEFPFRYFSMSGDADPLFVWLQRYNHPIDCTLINCKASAFAVASKSEKVVGIIVEVSADGVYHRATPFAVQIPTSRTSENARIYEDAARMAQPARRWNLNQSRNTAQPARTKKPGRNELCPCGSGIKYKRCHGR